MAEKLNYDKPVLRGRHWHAYVNKYPLKPGDPESKWVMRFNAQSTVDESEPAPNNGKWVKVRFVEVE